MIKTPNFTQIPNVFFDEMIPDLNESELRVFLVIMRKTFGWSKTRDRISIGEISALTGMSRQGVLNGLNGKKDSHGIVSGGLVPRDLVTCYEHANGNEYEIVVSQETGPSQQGGPELVNKVDQPSQQGGPELVNKVDPQNKEKESLKKGNKILGEYTEDFEAFWSIYPTRRNANKAGAFKTWKARLRQNIPKELLMTCAKNYADDCRNRGIVDNWVMMAATFLNGRYVDFEKELPNVRHQSKVGGIDPSAFDGYGRERS